MHRSAFIYTDKLQSYDYGGGHPLKMIRLRLTHELLKSFDVFRESSVEYVEAEDCTRHEAESAHNPVYLDTLKMIDEGMIPQSLDKYGLGHGDNPAFRGVYAGSMLSTGASVQAARIVHSEKARVAFNISGGLHHAMPSRASGFCYINDPAVAIKYLVSQGLKVAYIDIDAHHGDGVQHIFYEDDQVMTVSLHEDPHYLFPGTGLAEDIGRGRGRGYSVNLPFLPGTGDEVFTWGFFELIPELMDRFRPDVIVAQLGCDTFSIDPLAHLELTTNGFTKMVQGFMNLDKPLVALGGGGYDVGNVARAWSLAFGVMAGIELPNELTEDYRELMREQRLSIDTLLRDEPFIERPEDIKRQRKHADEMMLVLRHEVFSALGRK